MRTLLRSGLCPALLSAALLAGCASRAAYAPLKAAATPPEASHRIGNVPFFENDADQCGPAALSSLLSYWGYPTRPEALRKELYIQRLRGSLPTDLVQAARVRGFRAELVSGDLDSLKAELRAGHPMIALLNLGYRFLPRGHYVVVTGYDDGKKGLYAHSGMRKDQFMSYGSFRRKWERADRCLIRILPPGRSPENALP